jgi:hypothetical protein
MIFAARGLPPLTPPSGQAVVEGRVDVEAVDVDVVDVEAVDVVDVEAVDVDVDAEAADVDVDAEAADVEVVDFTEFADTEFADTEFADIDPPHKASASASASACPDGGVRGGNPLTVNIFPKEPSPIFFKS